MVIEVLKNKYKCGCNRGTADLKKAGILDKLNAIIEWDISRFPKKQVIESDKDEWNKYFGPGCENSSMKRYKMKTALSVEPLNIENS